MNLFSGVGDTPWNGQPDIQLEVFDGDPEGVYIEYGYKQEDGAADEKDEYADIRVTNADLDAYREAHGLEGVWDPGLDPMQIKGTLYIHQSNFNGVCNKCTVGLFSESDKKGIFKQFMEQYPNVNLVVTSDTRYGNANGYHSLTFNVIDGEISNRTKK